MTVVAPEFTGMRCGSRLADDRPKEMMADGLLKVRGITQRPRLWVPHNRGRRYLRPLLEGMPWAKRDRQ